MPSYGRWQKQFEKRGVVVIGVHTPELPEERVESSVRRQVKTLGITYPILIDPKGANWDRWHVDAWPTIFLVDRRGRIRYRWEGELQWDGAHGEEKMAGLVEQLLREPN